ncbi:MAG: DinB family protein [Segetibacter sp.]|nr:DinB family protein [Segetibacter sp.]
MPAPVTGTYPAYFSNYINLVHADSVAEAIERYSLNIVNFFKSIPSEKVDHRYAEGKWSIKEMLQHIIDAERIFAYRALRISRHDKTPLPGFDENTYAIASNADARNWQSLLEEFEAVRKSTDLLLQSFTPEHLQQSGITNESPNTTIAISFVVFGHILHHVNILKERYL